ncbi:glycosyltransferase family 2 protein [Candidatus Minimicrobia vallesae]|uniref:glycosyltransferase family 2 protein n=1 Tax=Candidatus Minimicrobia vallesae TaxID=2841264 RepID=UPI002FCD895B
MDMFDEDFFMYYEDVDLSFRAQLAGWKVRFTPKAIAYHKVGASSKKVPGLAVYNTFKNLPLVFIKNIPRKTILVYRHTIFTNILANFRQRNPPRQRLASIQRHTSINNSQTRSLQKTPKISKKTAKSPSTTSAASSTTDHYPIKLDC